MENEQLKEKSDKSLNEKEGLEKTQRSGGRADKNVRQAKLKQSANTEITSPQRPPGEPPNAYIPSDQREKS